MQTGASALLPAAVVAALFGLVHAFDMAGRKAAVAVEPQRIDVATDVQGDLLADQDAGVPLATTDRQPETDMSIGQAELVEPVAAQENEVRPAKAPRKSRARRASAAKEVKVAELAPPEEVEATERAAPEVAEVALPVPSEEVAYRHVEPLFAPEPFVRQQHAVFGRKAR